ncbi:response regulator transcription factor [Aquimarina sp. 2201CG5-10]|uniref:response regulator transcription factor n=1 Tax=Aquimarina callyspongiae TaxID=3098150 RepID=UPI002AB4B525|nr:response regulator transcription factor [Aquimarina sp. 2201CG5-10]MDY8136081.1 response regulator transcription factor [Aquimarina sp. 2201CG5-10]
MIKIIIADDHRIVLEGLSSLVELANDIKIVGLANNGQEIIDLLNSQEVDIVVSDIEMPIMDGVEVTRSIRNQFPKVKILILTMYSSIGFIRKILEIGAHGYILKNKGKEELIDAIKTIYDGGEYFGREIEKTLRESLKKENVFDIVKLTKREIDVLKLIAKGDTTPIISEKLFIAHSTVETHRRNLIEKTGVKNSKGLVKYAFENGYS